ncbi:MAG TPA: hypothetical protein VKZ49_11305 [Polyangiaceae bacterium]|nr:hypothetical protein [Polyangiaceae bacterium]
MLGQRQRRAARAGLLALLAATPAFAQEVEIPEAPAAAGDGLRSRLGLAVGERLLGAEDSRERRRGLTRLGATGGARALERLVAALDDGGAAKTAEERLTAVRALAPHAAVASVQRALVRVMNDPGDSTDGDRRLDDWVRQSAALALAASGDAPALDALGAALRQPGPIADAAKLAVTAHPPRDLDPLLRARGTPTVALVRTLAALADQRAFYPLRELVMQGSPQVRAEAALALTELGNLETVELARHWLQTEEALFARIAATRILALAGTADSAEHIAALLADEATREAGVSLCLLAPAARLTRALLEALGAPSFRQRPEPLLSALGRTGSPEAITRLARLVADPGLGPSAAYALALSGGSTAGARITELFGSAATRRLAARAAVVHTLATGEEVDGTGAVLEALLRSSAPQDRAAGAWGIASLSPERGIALLDAKDAAIVRGVGAASAHPALAPAAARRLARASDPVTQIALAPALLADAAADGVPTARLTEWVDRATPLSAAAAYALGARLSPLTRTTIEDLLDAPDPLLRAQVALGLSRSQGSAAVGLLAARYAFEPDADVRRALVAALGRHPTAARPTLELARALDPSPEARQLARLALAGRAPQHGLGGPGTVWVAVAGADGAPVAGWVTLSSGLSVPVVSGPDGLLVLSGLPGGPVTLRLAAPLSGGKSVGDPR